MIFNRVLLGRFNAIATNRNNLASTLHKPTDLQAVRKYKNMGHARDKESVIEIAWGWFTLGGFLLIPIVNGFIQVRDDAAEKAKPPSERIEYDESIHNYNG